MLQVVAMRRQTIKVMASELIRARQTRTQAGARTGTVMMLERGKYKDIVGFEVGT